MTPSSELCPKASPSQVACTRMHADACVRMHAQLATGKMCAYIILVSTLGMLAYTIIQDIIYIVEGKNVPTD